ncbi:hypothetical protein EDD21DRAFT_390964 [Dissophora ornata]|nr:hypothetical protein EDD21DRAFT_390964 [Dissophora ornata]
MSTAKKNQFHHYIPRFILRHFTEEPRKGEPLGTREPRGKGKPRRKGKHNEQTRRIKTYRVLDHSITPEDVGRIYGEHNMYKDIRLEDCMEFEDRLSKMESSAATFIQTIMAGQDISLTRPKLEDFKKFLTIMMYRGESRRGQYVNDSFDPPTRMIIRNHMRINNIANLQDVWFKNLQWIIKTPVDDIVEEERSANIGMAEALVARSVANLPMDSLSAGMRYEGPINILELMEFAIMFTNFVCIWEAQEGSEFILTDNSFGCYEKHDSVVVHNFFIISPKYAVVLVKRSCMIPPGAKRQKGSWSENIHANPEVVYANKNTRNMKTGMVNPELLSPDDVFKYRRIVVPKQRVWFVNSIFLDVKNKYISYKSDGAMYRTLKYYDRNKKELFDNRYDYSILKRKLFLEMNRTHST